MRDPARRIVTITPLRELWNCDGVLPLKRGKSLSAADIKARLRSGPIQFVVANVGGPLRWVEPAASFQFWKEEIKPHLVEPAAESGFTLDAFPGSYAYIATEWSVRDQQPPVVLLEMHH